MQDPERSTATHRGTSFWPLESLVVSNLRSAESSVKLMSSCGLMTSARRRDLGHEGSLEGGPASRLARFRRGSRRGQEGLASLAAFPQDWDVRIDWWRGILRFWGALSVLWVLAIGWLAWGEYISSPKQDLALQQKLKNCELPTDERFAALRSWDQDAVLEKLCPAYGGLSWMGRAKFRARERYTGEDVSSKRREYAIILALPPFATYVALEVLRWIVKGFVRDQA